MDRLSISRVTNQNGVSLAWCIVEIHHSGRESLLFVFFSFSFFLLEGLTKNRLKRSCFVHESKKLSRQFHDRLPQSTLPFFPPDMSEPWVTDITDIKVHTTVPSLSGGDTQDDTVKQSLALAMIAERYPQEAWIHVFTDGSATNVVTNGGAGILVHFPGGQKASANMAVGKHCSS